MLTFTFSDCIGYSAATGTGITLNVPIIIESSTSPADTVPVSTITPSYFPPQATSQPQPSYNFYDYTVSGYEYWSPANNPVTAMAGGGTISTINIQHSLTVRPGARLMISGGMTLQMGPQAHITIQNNTSMSGAGAFLTVDSSILTAYRGCDGTDESTWSGVTVTGDPTAGQTSSDPSYVSPQAQALFSEATISFADIGIENGFDATTSGGIIITVGGGYWTGLSGPWGGSFYDNKQAIAMWPYHNIDAASGIEHTELSHFIGCSFMNDNNEWFLVTNVVTAIDNHNVGFDHCTFTNSTGNPITTAIYGLDAGIGAGSCVFGTSGTSYLNYTTAIDAAFASGTETAYLDYNIFNNDQFGIVISGGVAPVLFNNIFNIPAYAGTGFSTYPGSDGVLILNDQNVGLILQGTTGYSANYDTFQTNATLATTSDLGYLSYTTGTIESNTGSDNNEVTGNVFTGVGVAMSSNFVNNSSFSGLQYLCNTDNYTGFDICAMGDISGAGGINPVQGTTSGTSGVYFDLPAGNVFSNHWNIYDLQQPLYYHWYEDGSLTDPETPVIYTPEVSPVAYASSSNCHPVLSPYAPSATSRTTDAPVDPSLNYATAAQKINYYMIDTNGTTHRDSLYYWAAKMGTAYGDLLITDLLIQDSLIDSANTVYNGIVSKYSMTGAEANDFAQGRYLMNILIDKRINNRNMLSLTGSQVTSLQSIKANSTMWAHARAENWLYAYDGEALNDTLLYPNAPDTTYTGGRKVPSQHTASAPANKVYPNPVHDMLQVMYTATSTDAIVIQIQDIAGQIIITQPLQSGVPASVDMISLAPGMYLYRILEGTKVTMIGKVAKE